MPSPQLAVWMDETNGGKIDVVAVDTDGVPGRHRRRLHIRMKYGLAALSGSEFDDKRHGNVKETVH